VLYACHWLPYRTNEAHTKLVLDKCVHDKGYPKTIYLIKSLTSYFDLVDNEYKINTVTEEYCQRILNIV